MDWHVTGKSVLCSRIITFLESEKVSTVAYFFCNCYTEGKDQCSQILRVLALQLIRPHTDLASHVADNYANRGCNPSLKQLKKLLPELLTTITSTRVVIDGLDECLEKDQKSVLQELLSISGKCGQSCKFLFASREDVYLSRALRARPYIDLRKRKSEIDKDIKIFISRKLSQLRREFESTIIDDIERRVVEKADGKFVLPWSMNLWLIHHNHELADLL